MLRFVTMRECSGANTVARVSRYHLRLVAVLPPSIMKLHLGRSIKNPNVVGKVRSIFIINKRSSTKLKT